MRSETWFEKIFERSPDPTWIINEQNLFILCNVAAAKALGYSSANLLQSMHPSALSPKLQPDGQSSQEKANEMMAIAHREGVHRFEWEHQRLNGECFPVEVTLSHLDEGVKGYLYCIWRDITERKQAEQVQKKSEELFASTFDLAAIGLAHVAPDGSWLRVNQRLCDIVGYSMEELLQLSFQDITHPDDLEKDLAYVNQMLASEIDSYTMEKRYICKDQSDVWINLTVSLVRQKNGDPDYFICAIEDISERMKANLLVEETGKMAHVGGWELVIETHQLAWTKELYRIHEVSFDYSPSVTEAVNFYAPEDRPVIQHAVQRAIDFGEPYDLKLRFITAKGNHLWVHTLGEAHLKNGKPFKISGTFQDITELKHAGELLQQKEFQAQRVIETALDAFIQLDGDGIIKEWNPHAELIFGWKKEEVVGRLLTESIIPAVHSKAHSDGIRHFIATGEGPVLNKTVEIEALHRDGYLLPVELSIVMEKDDGSTFFNAFLRDVTERRKGRDELLKMHANLKENLAGTVQAISKAVEARDPYTGGHQLRVAEVSSAIAKEMGLSANQIEGIRMGASIHDIGKIQTPAEILSLPRILTELEFQLIKAHTSVGYEILKDINFPWPVAEIAHQHHERVDGTGYPQGLKGEEICLEARIVAVADVMEAISSHRPYRPALGIETALNEIKANRGVFYDSMVADACLKAFNKGMFNL